MTEESKKAETAKVCYIGNGARKCKEIPKPTLFSAPNCPWCSRERGILRGLGVGFKEVSVTDNSKLAELVKVSGQTGTPTLVVGRKIVVGFEPRAIERALGIHRRR